jgi:nitroreductase
MELAEALRRRRMIRHYTGAPIPPESLDRIVAAGLSAPTAGDSQGIAIVTVTEPQRIGAIAAACGEAAWTGRGHQPWISTAGALLAICLEPEVYRQRYAQPDKDPAVLAAIP